MKQKDIMETLDKITKVKIVTDYGKVCVEYSVRCIKASLKNAGKTLELVISKKLKKR